MNWILGFSQDLVFSEFQDLDIVLRWILAFFLIQGYGGPHPGTNFFDEGPLLPDERRARIPA
jgi:hypothetical protein